jgi:hypothetical protein
VLIIPSSWGSQLPSHNNYLLYFPISARRIKLFFWRRCRGRERRPLQGEFFAHTSFTLFYCFALLYFYLHHFIKNPKKIRILDSCFYLLAFSLSCCSLSTFWRTSQ